MPKHTKHQKRRINSVQLDLVEHAKKVLAYTPGARMLRIPIVEEKNPDKDPRFPDGREQTGHVILVGKYKAQQMTVLKDRVVLEYTFETED